VLRQYLTLNLIDEMHLAVSPVLLREGEHLFDGLDLPRLGFVSCRTVLGDGALLDEWETAGQRPNNRDAVTHIAQLLAAFRAARVPIFNIRH